MRRFRERNPLALAVIGTGLIGLAVVGAVNFGRLPFVSDATTYQAEFPDAAGLNPGDIVMVAGVSEGTVRGLALDGAHVRVSFTVNGSVDLGTTTAVAAKVLTPIGQEYLAVSPAGAGRLAPGGVIPTARTSEPSTLVGDLAQFSQQTQQVNLAQLEQALNVTSQDLEGTPGSTTAAALSGLAQLSSAIASRQGELSQFVQQAQQLTATLVAHRSELVDLVGQSDLVLQVLDQRRQAITTLLASTTTLSQEVGSLLSTHQAQLGPLLGDLQTVTGVLAKDSTDLANALPLLAGFERYAANVTGSGTFGDVVMPTLLIPDNVIQECSAPGAVSPTTGCLNP